MSMYVRGTESFIPPNAPIVGINPINPMLYRFNNIGNILNPYMRTPPYVNEIQFYNPITGQLGPNISQNGILSDMSQNMQNDPRYTPVINNQICSKQYNNNKINVGIIGNEADLNTVISILDKHFATSTVAPPVTPSAPATAPVIEKK